MRIAIRRIAAQRDNPRFGNARAVELLFQAINRRQVKYNLSASTQVCDESVIFCV
jgi:hypothetical protein